MKIFTKFTVAFAFTLALSACSNTASTPEDAIANCNENDPSIYCFAQAAAQFNDPALCEQAPNSNTLRNCYEKTAYLIRNPETCSQSRALTVCQRNISLETDNSQWQLIKEGETDATYQGQSTVKLYFNENKSNKEKTYLEILNDETFTLPPRIVTLEFIELESSLSQEEIEQSTSGNPLEVDIKSIVLEGDHAKLVQ